MKIISIPILFYVIFLTFIFHDCDMVVSCFLWYLLFFGLVEFLHFVLTEDHLLLKQKEIIFKKNAKDAYTGTKLCLVTELGSLS